MARMEGIDVSHWNKLETIPDVRPEFAMIKLSEGKTFKDSQAMAHAWMCKTLGIPFGFYHYARAEKNTPEEEADFFVSLIPQDDLGHAVLALDYEGKALSIKDVDTWARAFCQRVYEKTRVLPVLYCSQSTVKRFPKTCKYGVGLWVARYRNKLLGYGDINPWKFAAMWQYTSKPHDKNIFYGSKTQFLKYGGFT